MEQNPQQSNNQEEESNKEEVAKPAQHKAKHVVLIAVIIAAIAVGIAFAGYYFMTDEKVIFTTTDSNQILPTEQNNEEETEVVVRNDAASILYVYKQFSPSVTKIYQSDISGQNKIETDITYLEGSKFQSNKNNNVIARWSDKKLEVADATELDFGLIVEIVDPQTSINDVIWSADGTKLVVMTLERLESDNIFSDSIKRVYLMNNDGSDRRLVVEFQKPNFVSFQGLNIAENELYWFEQSGGGGFVSNFSVIDLTDGSTKAVKKDLDPELDASMNLSSDFAKAYYIKDNVVVEYTLADDTKKILYELNNDDQDEYGNQSFIRGLRLSPNDDLLVFTRRIEPSNEDVILSIDLPSGDVETFLDDSKYTSIGPAHWSTNGKYLWFETWCNGCNRDSGINNDGEYYIMDMETKNMSLFFKGEIGQEVLLNTYLNFISWISE
jgi:flagellar basal body-associated protein FliL